MRRAAPMALLLALLPLPLPLVVAARGGAIPGERPPNLVFVYADDQARWGVGAYGNAEVVTPHLDRLARDGALFRNAFTCTPVCSPSRAGMMTGRLGTQVGITDWINPKVEPELGLDPSAVLWPELLKAGGYATGLFGKWHLGDRDRFHPTRQGYDVFMGFRGGGNTPIDPVLEADGVVAKREGATADLITDAAIAFIEAHRDGPFLASLHFREPHAPYAPTREVDAAPVAGLDPTIPSYPGLPGPRVGRLTREYYASIHSIDRNVGRVREALDRLGVADRTIVIFSSDHGYMIGHHGLLHKGNATWLAAGHAGHRPNMFEESIRVPLLVVWPGVVRPGTTIDRVVSNLDTFPSMLDLAGIGTPANLRVHGRSWAPLLRGGAPAPAWDDTLFGQYDMHHYQEARMRMIRTPEWKWVRHYEPGGADELYSLAADPGESRNLAGDPARAGVRDELDARLRAWMAAIDDPLAERGR
jgi:uncharacterized sulfatase